MAVVEDTKLLEESLYKTVHLRTFAPYQNSLLWCIGMNYFSVALV